MSKFGTSIIFDLLLLFLIHSENSPIFKLLKVTVAFLTKVSTLYPVYQSVLGIYKNINIHF
jgi:hypothetical protein